MVSWFIALTGIACCLGAGVRLYEGDYLGVATRVAWVMYATACLARLAG